MRALSKLQSLVMAVGAVLIVAGALMGMVVRTVAPWVMAVGVACYVAMQVQQRYDGTNFTIQRLRRILLLSDVLLVLAALLMIADAGNPFGIDLITYINYVHNNWVVALLLAALIQLYAVFRMDAELRREAKKR